jgi:opacity protein-like surface antigen
MRLSSRAALILAATLIAAPAYAQTSFSVAAGASVPVGTTSDGYNMGYAAILGIGIKPPLSPLGLRLEGMLNSMETKNPTFAGFKALRTLAGVANVTLSGVGTPLPMGYLIGGVGMYAQQATDACATCSTDTETDLGFNVGAGINFPLTGFSTFLEARFHYISDTKQKFVPITFGLKF